MVIQNAYTDFLHMKLECYKECKHLYHSQFWMNLAINLASIDSHVGIHQCIHMCMCMLTKCSLLWTKSMYNLTRKDTFAFVTYYKVILFNFTFIMLHTSIQKCNILSPTYRSIGKNYSAVPDKKTTIKIFWQVTENQGTEIHSTIIMLLTNQEV